jgi:hypothetical protein
MYIALCLTQQTDSSNMLNMYVDIEKHFAWSHVSVVETKLKVAM